MDFASIKRISWFIKKLSFLSIGVLFFVTVNGQLRPGYTDLGEVPIAEKQHADNLKALSKNPFERNGIADTNTVFVFFQNSMYAIHLKSDSLQIFRTLMVEKYVAAKKQYKPLTKDEMIYDGKVNDSLVNQSWFSVFKDLDKGAEFTGDYPSRIGHGSSDSCDAMNFISISSSEELVININAPFKRRTVSSYYHSIPRDYLKEVNRKRVYQMCIWIYLKRLKVGNETLFTRLNTILNNSGHWKKLDTWVKSLGIGKYRFGSCPNALNFEVLANGKILWDKREYNKIPVNTIFDTEIRF